MAYAWTYNVKMRYNHVDNGQFSDNSFLQAVTQEIQTISYCGVNSQLHHGKAEKRIRDLQEQTREKLHHTKSRCESAIELALWTYSLRQATHLRNCLLDKEDASHPLERLFRISVYHKSRENHLFGCPFFPFIIYWQEEE